MSIGLNEYSIADYISRVALFDMQGACLLLLHSCGIKQLVQSDYKVALTTEAYMSFLTS